MSPADDFLRALNERAFDNELWKVTKNFLFDLDQRVDALGNRLADHVFAEQFPLVHVAPGTMIEMVDPAVLREAEADAVQRERDEAEKVASLKQAFFSSLSDPPIVLDGEWDVSFRDIREAHEEIIRSMFGPCEEWLWANAGVHWNNLTARNEALGLSPLAAAELERITTE